MYSELLDPETNKGFPPPSPLHLRHEALALYAAGSHPVAVTLMTGVYHLLRDPEAKQRLVDEVHTVWPVLDDQVPRYEDLEKLPFLASVFSCLIEFALTTEETDSGY
jgi:cytochrome P450